METGKLERVKKLYELKGETKIGVSVDELKDKNDSFGLIDVEAEPQTFFSIESMERNG